MKINLVVLNYRGSYFFKEYGPAVRDLQMLLTLAQMDEISLTLLERPISIYERVLGKFFPKGILDNYNIRVKDTTSYDLLRPLRRRLWWNHSVTNYLSKLLPELKQDNAVNVFLDFMPIGTPTLDSLDGWFYWYDFIDNFTKHNRFTKAERKAVQRKYLFVKKHAQLLTFVSKECFHNVNLGQPSRSETRVVTNKVFEDLSLDNKRTELYKSSKELFDFGFIGFVTDKIDINFIKRLARHYTVAIYGDFYDQKVKSKLSALDNVSLLGGFHYGDLPAICDTFKVGLLPYRQEKSHDGSPLKLYEYLRYCRPVLTSIDYELINEKYIINYRNSELNEDTLSQLIEFSGNEEIAGLLSEEDYFKKPLKEIITMVMPKS
jgi:hypothetical protein